MKVCSVDTNIVLRYLLSDVPEQEKLASGIMKNTLLKIGIADAVFVELEYALVSHYSFTRNDVADTFDDIIALNHINCNRALLVRVLPQYRTAMSISYVDICLDTYAHLTQSEPLFTFDKNLAKKLAHSTLLV